jgi:hypothetical protein
VSREFAATSSPDGFTASGITMARVSATTTARIAASPMAANKLTVDPRAAPATTPTMTPALRMRACLTMRSSMWRPSWSVAHAVTAPLWKVNPTPQTNWATIRTQKVVDKLPLIPTAMRAYDSTIDHLRLILSATTPVGTSNSSTVASSTDPIKISWVALKSASVTQATVAATPKHDMMNPNTKPSHR